MHTMRLLLFITQKGALHKNTAIHQITTMLDTSKNVLFPGHNHLLTSGADDHSMIKVNGRQHWWLAGGYDLEIGLFRGG